MTRRAAGYQAPGAGAWIVGNSTMTAQMGKAIEISHLTIDSAVVTMSA